MEKKVKVLVAEGAESGFDIVAEELNKAAGRYDIKRVRGGKDFIRALKEFAPDAILYDYEISSLSAVDAIEAVRKDRPDTPFIIISGIAGEDSAVEALRHGATDYLLKDRLSRLVPAIERTILEAGEHIVRREAEAALARSQAKLKTLFDNMAEAVALNELVFGNGLSPVNYRIADVNKQFERVVGLGRDNIVGSLATEVFKSDIPPLLDMFANVVSTGVPEHIEFFFSNTGRHFNVSASRWGETGFAAIFSDITERKAIEVALRESDREIKKAYQELKDAQHKLIQSEKMAAVGRFASGVAHEVKNPLGIILSGAEFLRSKLREDDIDMLSTLEKIEDASLRANFVLQSLLQFAKPSRLDVEPVRPEDIISPIVGMMASRARFDGIKVSTEFGNDVTDILADKNQMQQVIFNIMKNSMEAVKRGGNIKIRVYREEAEGHGARMCVIEVADDGHGISEADRLKVAEPFFTTRPEGKGTGLGLFISKTIVANHGGNIVINSKAGKGTTVKIIMPLPKKEKL